MYKAIMDFARSVGLKSKSSDGLLSALLIPNQFFASEDNKLILTAVYIKDKQLAMNLIGDYADSIDRINHQGCLHFEYSMLEEIHGIEEKKWAQKLEDYLPYEKRTAELFSFLKTPLLCHGIGGNGLNICLSTQDGYYVTVTELDTSAEVMAEDVVYLLSGQAILDLMARKP